VGGANGKIRKKRERSKSINGLKEPVLSKSQYREKGKTPQEKMSREAKIKVKIRRKENQRKRERGGGNRRKQRRPLEGWIVSKLPPQLSRRGILQQVHRKGLRYIGSKGKGGKARPTVDKDVPVVNKVIKRMHQKLTIKRGGGRGG